MKRRRQPPDEERYRRYVRTARRIAGVRRASNYTLALAVLFGLGGISLRLFPERENLGRIKKEEGELREEYRRLLQRKFELDQEDEFLLKRDPDFLEQRSRELFRWMKKPDERLFNLPEEMKEEWRSLDPEPGD